MTPTPGSRAALALGCTCPVLDNAHGHGAYTDSYGAVQFWTRADCPLHGSGWRAELDAMWPDMPELDGRDLFAETCGPPSGEA